MDKFIVSARKYRPETFKSVIGQNSITGTLKNAIKNNHLGHAYLFCGPRGVGKTTCARIFAKTINCENVSEDVEPCNVCESCKAFNESRSYNIHELDAASNNSVEDIRTLTEQVRIPPQIGKYSVYIIDEVHMLSAQAFNAFLKTLEEPPAHAVFILATTEKHKIIPTILSRCQIFDFNRIRVDDAVKYLEYIAGKENITYEKEALHVIAQKADGAMRDALSVFDQVVSFSGNNIEYQSVIDNLNILGYEYYFNITQTFLDADVSKALLIFNEILDKGFDAHNFLGGLASHCRDLLVSKDQSTVSLLEVSDNLRTRYLQQASQCEPEFLFQALEICNQADVNYKSSHNQRLLIELALVRLTGIHALKKKRSSDEPEALKEHSDLTPTGNTSSTPTDSTESRKVKLKDNPVDIPPTQPAAGGYDNAPVKNTAPSSAGTDTGIRKEETVRKNLIRSTDISIKDVMSNAGPEPDASEPAEEEGADEPETEIDLNDMPFSMEELLKKWNQFADSIREERPRISITLKSRKPGLKPDYRIEVLMDNASQLEDFNQNIKLHLSTYLKQELNNSLIQIIPGLGETENVQKKVYTSEDKFQYMNKKNPNLNKLKQQFNLELE